MNHCSYTQYHHCCSHWCLALIVELDFEQIVESEKGVAHGIVPTSLFANSPTLPALYSALVVQCKSTCLHLEQMQSISIHFFPSSQSINPLMKRLLLALAIAIAIALIALF